MTLNPKCHKQPLSVFHLGKAEKDEARMVTTMDELDNMVPALELAVPWS